MSRTLLAARLRELEHAGIVERRDVPGNRRSHEYHLTIAGRELAPIIEGLGTWGQRWIMTAIDERDLDPSLLMWDIRRNLRRDELPDRKTVLLIEFRDAPSARRRWWLVIEPGAADLCMTDPGFEVDVSLKVRLVDLTRYWLGHLGWKELVRSDGTAIEGPVVLRRSLPGWLGRSTFAGIGPASG